MYRSGGHRGEKNHMQINQIGSDVWVVSAGGKVRVRPFLPSVRF